MVLRGYAMEKGDSQPTAYTVMRRERTAHRRRISPGADTLQEERVLTTRYVVVKSY
jgi:hypothetical protein